MSANPKSRNGESEFVVWIKAMGDKEVARIAKVKLRTVRSWREGTRSPKPETARLIARRNRRLTIEHIYG